METVKIELTPEQQREMDEEVAELEVKAADSSELSEEQKEIDRDIGLLIQETTNARSSVYTPKRKGLFSRRKHAIKLPGEGNSFKKYAVATITALAIGVGYYFASNHKFNDIKPQTSPVQILETKSVYSTTVSKLPTREALETRDILYNPTNLERKVGGLSFDLQLNSSDGSQVYAFFEGDHTIYTANVNNGLVHFNLPSRNARLNVLVVNNGVQTSSFKYSLEQIASKEHQSIKKTENKDDDDEEETMFASGYNPPSRFNIGNASNSMLYELVNSKLSSRQLAAYLSGKYNMNISKTTVNKYKQKQYAKVLKKYLSQKV